MPLLGVTPEIGRGFHADVPVEDVVIVKAEVV